MKFDTIEIIPLFDNEVKKKEEKNKIYKIYFSLSGKDVTIRELLCDFLRKVRLME